MLLSHTVDVTQKAPGKGLAAIEGAEKRPHDVAEALWTITSQVCASVKVYVILHSSEDSAALMSERLGVQTHENCVFC